MRTKLKIVAIVDIIIGVAGLLLSFKIAPFVKIYLTAMEKYYANYGTELPYTASQSRVIWSYVVINLVVFLYGVLLLIATSIRNRTSSEFLSKAGGLLLWPWVRLGLVKIDKNNSMFVVGVWLTYIILTISLVSVMFFLLH